MKLKTRMKSGLSLLAAAAVIASMAGCGEKYVSIDETSNISDYTETVTTEYSETAAQGLDIYSELFDLDNKVSVSINMTKDEISKLQNDFLKYTENDSNRKSEIYRRADVTVTVGDKSYTIEETGIRLKGNQSIRPFYSKDGTPNLCSFKLSFDETFDDPEEYGDDVKAWQTTAARDERSQRTFATLEELDLKWNISYDETFVREIYSTKLFEASDLLVQKIGLAQMSVNGSNYGLMKIYEPVDKAFLEKRLPKSALGGDLYKCMWSECDNSGKRTGRWRGVSYQTDDSYGIQKNSEGIKFNFNLKTNKKTSDHAAVSAFLETINKPGLTKDELESVLDVDSFARFMAAEYFAGDPDDIRNNANNHYIYFRKDNGKAIFIVYDNDRTLGITYGMNKNCAVIDPYSDQAAALGEQRNALIKNTITHSALPEFTYIRDKYADALKALSETEMLKSDADFNEMYSKAKANYEDIVTPYMTFANQAESFAFSLDGNKDGGQTANMSFEQFRSQIMETYSNSAP